MQFLGCIQNKCTVPRVRYCTEFSTNSKILDKNNKFMEWLINLNFLACLSIILGGLDRPQRIHDIRQK